MTFWGIEVRPGKPYTLPCNKDGPALRISQATLSFVSKSSTDSKTSTKRSVVQCNVGKSSPVLLCALLPDRIETCPLDLEFKEDKEIVFSILGPQSIYLTGYHLNVGRHHLSGCDDDTESYGEDIGETESDASKESVEDEYDTDDSFINDEDPGEQTPPRRAKTRRGDEHIHLSPRSTCEKKEKCSPRHKRLKKKYQVSDSDEDKYQVINSEEDKEASQRWTKMESSAASCFDSEEDDKSLISSFLKSRTSKMVKSSTTETPEDGKQEKLDAIRERKVDQPCDLSLLSVDDINVVNGTPKDKRKKKKNIVQAEINQSVTDSKSGLRKGLEDENIGNQLHIDDIENRKKKKDKVNEELKLEELYLQTKEQDPTNSNAQESNRNLEDQKKLKMKKKKKSDKNEHMTREEDSIPPQLKEPFLENVQVNPIVGDVQEFSTHSQDENEKLKKKHKKKKGAKSKTTGIGDDVGEPLESEGLCLDSKELDQRADNDQRTNTEMQNEKVHGLEVDKVEDENEIKVPRKKKRKHKSDSEKDVW